MASLRDNLPDQATKETLLVVEDDEDVRTFTVEVLDELGYRVLEAADGHSALDTLQKHPGIDLLFTDIGLPKGMNGRELADEATRRWPGLKVLFTTGYARNAIVHHGRLDPGVELITKPFTQAALASKLGVKETVVRRIETGNMTAPIRVIDGYRRLAAERGIELAA